MAISVDTPEVSERLRERLRLPVRFLCDTAGSLLDRLAIRHRAGRPPAAMMPAGHRQAVDDRDIFLPTTFLVDGSGVIRWIHRPDTYRVRATPEEVIAALDRFRAADAAQAERVGE